MPSDATVATQAEPGAVVVVGSSLTGLLISLSLSEAGIEHTLIGGPPPADVPRLGESMNEPAAPELFRRFGDELAHCFVKKNHISLFNGPFVTSIHIGNPNLSLERVANSVLRRGQVRLPRARTILTHIDRVPFDKAVYAKALAQSPCRFVESLVTEVSHDAATDQISALTLANGSRLDGIRYAFDATGPRGVLAQGAGVPRGPISTPQRTVWTHRRCASVEDLPREWWLHGTNLLRLLPEEDGIAGIAWVIPVGTTLSLGLSVDAGDAPDERYDDDALVGLVVAACERRGLAVQTIFPEAWKTCGLRNQYYIRKRAYGANWLLAGASYLSVWFPTSSGMWTSTAAAGLAAKLIEDPQGVGAQYERMMRKLLAFHDLQEQMVHGKTFRTVGECLSFWALWLSFIPGRLASYFRIVNGPRKRRITNYVLEAASKRFHRHPRFQMLMWGFIPARGTHQPDLSRQVDVYPNYFRPARHRFGNVVRGLRHLFGIRHYEEVELGRRAALALREGSELPEELRGGR